MAGGGALGAETARASMMTMSSARAAPVMKSGIMGTPRMRVRSSIPHEGFRRKACAAHLARTRGNVLGDLVQKNLETATGDCRCVSLTGSVPDADLICYTLATMKRSSTLIALFALITLPLTAQSYWYGRWEGAMELSDGTMPFGLSVSEGGVLLDLPMQNLFGYPSARAQADKDSISVTWNFGGGQLNLDAKPSPSGAEGSFGQGQAGGTLILVRSSFQPDPATQLAVTMKDGAVLAGTLTLPVDGMDMPPLLILHAGLGAADRDGNNYNIPGKNDALKQLSQSLARVGVATYRYDKRGSGQSTWLVGHERELSFEAWIRDLVSIVERFSVDSRFSSVWVLGMNDGATVAAAAAGLSSPSGLIVACTSASGPLDSFRRAVSDAPEEFRVEGEAIIASLLAGRTVDEPSGFYSTAFRPSFQPYLIEAFRHDPETELAAYKGAILIAQGDLDLQVTMEDFAALGQSAPKAVAIIVPRMNHVLKEVPADVEENLAAFSDPSYPVSETLVGAIGYFITGK
ncbi:MAG: hypothetical protein E4H20_03410 [Spirochaetales bacterium]|nr:MAG: hypothetical protein E4H20_03410 [Spirochaetales bacterium]